MALTLLQGNMLKAAATPPTPQDAPTQAAPAHDASQWMIRLDGQWQVTLDGQAPASITLPGTLTDAGLGTPCTLKPSMERETFLNLKAKHAYVGKATYTRQVTVPKNWKKQRVVLHLERILWTSQVTVNGAPLPQQQESLSTPHEYDITDRLLFGQTNTISITVDNSRRYDISTNDLAHCYTNETQTKWNGMLGDISLQAKPQTFVSRVAVYPETASGRVNVRICLDDKQAAGGKKARHGKVHFTIVSPQGTTAKDTVVAYDGRDIAFSTHLSAPQPWDEFAANVYTACAEVVGAKGADSYQTSFGFRTLTNDNALLQINKRRMFLRGTLESCVFPLKGYPATDVAAWTDIFRKAKEYGLNHLRFHSWCPPEAAFTAADRLGLYLQIELPVWTLNIGKDAAAMHFLYDEADRILAAYGNHPSFCFLSLGNELQSDFQALDSLLLHVKKDPRRLYTTTSFTFEKGHGDWPEPHDDFWVSQWSKKGWLRGQGVFEERPVSFRNDYSAAIDGLPVPVVTHEIGQYSVYPDIAAIPKYTGNLQPLNLISIKDDLQRKGRLGMAPRYLEATTRFAAILYKEEIERALKTPGYSGYQLLGLTDYPGQGTALVGLADVFWDSKDNLATQTFRQACAPVVPLAFYDKATWTNDETFRASFKVANFSADLLRDATLSWELKAGATGKPLAQGRLTPQQIAVGNTQELGDIAVPLSSISQAERLTLSVSIDGTPYTNTWNIWCYPATLDTDAADVVETNDINKAREALAMGRSVLLNLPQANTIGLEGKFLPVFWSPVHFPNQPGTMGVLCNPAHAALAQFPTEAHSNWQWWDLCKHATTMQLDSITGGAEVIVGMMDNFYKNRNLALVWQTCVGKGRLMVSSIDLSDTAHRPVARQLRHSLLQYMKSSDFHPATSLSFEAVQHAIYQAQAVEQVKKSIYE